MSRLNSFIKHQRMRAIYGTQLMLKLQISQNKPDCVQIKGGGSGRIVKILYLLLDEENDVHCCRKTDLGSHTTFDKF